MRVLYVDDERTIGRVVSIWLERRGHLVRLAHDLASARALVREQGFDAAFIDLRLGGESGFDLHAWLVAEVPDLARHVAFVSGDIAPNDETVNLLERLGCPVIAKPFELHELERVLHRWAMADGAELRERLHGRAPDEAHDAPPGGATDGGRRLTPQGGIRAPLDDRSPSDGSPYE
jgi:NtrC-family two-component system response regulator AlgB